MVKKCCLQNTSLKIVNVLPRLKFERDASEGAWPLESRLDSSRSDGHDETWEGIHNFTWLYQKTILLRSMDFFSFHNFFMNIKYKKYLLTLVCNDSFSIYE